MSRRYQIMHVEESTQEENNDHSSESVEHSDPTNITSETLCSSFKRYANTVAPYAGLSLLALSNIFVADVFLGRRDPTYLAAHSLSMGVETFVSIVGGGVLFAVGVHGAELVGKQRLDSMGRLFHRSLVLVPFLFMLGAILCATAKYSLGIFTSDQNLLNQAQQYLFWFIVAIPANFTIEIETQILLATGRSYWVALAYLIKSLTTILFSIPLILGVGNFSGLGLEGYGIAVALGSWITVASVTLGLRFIRRFDHLNLFRNFSVREDGIVPSFKEMLAVGLPIGAQLGVQAISAIGVTLVLVSHGVAALAALQITSQYFSPLYALLFGAGHATAVLVSTFRGENNAVLSRRFGYMNLGISVTFSALLASIFILASDGLTKLFLGDDRSDEENILPLTRVFFPIQGGLALLTAVTVASTGALRGLLDTFTPMVINAVNELATLGMVILLNNLVGLEATLMGGLLPNAIFGAFLLARWVHYAKQLGMPDSTTQRSCSKPWCCLFGYQRSQTDNDQNLLGDQGGQVELGSSYLC